MAIPVKLPVFEGPLDLLLHLIDENKIDIYDIPVAEITDQYLDYVRRMEHEDMDVTSEFLVMAATLLDIKSRMLLPREKNAETGEEEGDPREELVRRLLEYKTFKYLSEELAVRREQTGVRFFRTQDLPPEVLSYRPPIDYEDLLKDTDLRRLEQVFGEVLRRKKSRRDPIRSGFGKIQREEVSIDAKTLYVRAWLQAHPKTDFRALLETQESKEEVIVTFLILLELMKTQKVRIVQDGIGSDILIETLTAEAMEAPAAAETMETPVSTETAETLAESETAEAPAAAETMESPAATESAEPPAATETAEPPAATEVISAGTTAGSKADDANSASSDKSHARDLSDAEPSSEETGLCEPGSGEADPDALSSEETGFCAPASGEACADTSESPVSSIENTASTQPLAVYPSIPGITTAPWIPDPSPFSLPCKGGEPPVPVIPVISEAFATLRTGDVLFPEKTPPESIPGESGPEGSMTEAGTEAAAQAAAEAAAETAESSTDIFARPSFPPRHTGRRAPATYGKEPDLPDCGLPQGGRWRNSGWEQRRLTRLWNNYGRRQSHQ